jgi:catechol 2,3-dioxygenase-like lactoylglutathione lyase family enzyme
VPDGPRPEEFHASVRVTSLPRSARFYAWLFGAQPKEWTHRYATFVRPELHTNFVVVVADGNLVEVYARLTDEELAGKPSDLEPTALA